MASSKRVTLEELKNKAALFQFAQECCFAAGGHVWGEVYHSQITDYPPGLFKGSRPGDSVVCVRCGTRISRHEIPPGSIWQN